MQLEDNKLATVIGLITDKAICRIRFKLYKYVSLKRELSKTIEGYSGSILSLTFNTI